MPGPEDKKNSGSGHAQPLDGSSSSASSNQQPDKLRESDFITGRLPGKPATSTSSSSSSAPALPIRGKPSLGQNIVNKHLKQQHLQVVPGFRRASEYAESLRESDEAYRRAHALHPQESLQSVNIRVANEARRKSTGQLDDPDYPHLFRPFPTMVTAEFKFEQKDLYVKGDGICLALSVSFILYRRLGYDCKKIFELFRQHSKAFVRLQAKYEAIRLAHVATNSLTKVLQAAEERLLKSELPGISLPSPAKQHPQGSSAALGAVHPFPAQPFEKKDARHPMSESRLAPALGNVLFKSLSYFAIVGHFELDRDRRWTQGFRNWTHVPSRFYFFGKGTYQISNIFQETGRGVSAHWGMPRMDDATQEARSDGRLNSDPTEEDIWNPHIATHLFAAMVRKRRQSLWNGEVLESLPYFLLAIAGNKDGHAIVVEFNTDASDQNITTPRGVFDPSGGWVSLEQGYCSLDLDTLLHAYFYNILQQDVKDMHMRMDPHGGLLAYQLQMTSNGTTNDPAYIAQWGGLPWMRPPST